MQNTTVAKVRNTWLWYHMLIRCVSGDSCEEKLRKVKNVNIIKKLNTENKQLFGKLLETLPQKKERGHTESIAPCDLLIPEKHSPSEIQWSENNCSSRTIRIRFRNHRTANNESMPFDFFNSGKNAVPSLDTNSQDMKICNTVKSSLLKPNVENLPISSTVTRKLPNTYLGNNNKFHHITSPAEQLQLLRSRRNDQSKLHTSEDLSVHSASISDNSGLLPPVIVRNLTSFPLKNKKKITSEWTDSMLTLPLDNEKKERCISYPSVTKVLGNTMSEKSIAALEKWKNDLIIKLGEEGFRAYQQNLLDQGSLFHSTIKDYLEDSGKIPEIDPDIEGCWHSLQPILKCVDGVKAIESHVVHPVLMYHGVIDCIALYKGKPFLIEWKKSDKQKSQLSSTYDAPLQVAAYMGALNFDENYKMKVPNSMVVVAYTDGAPAHVHKISSTECSKYWKLWTQRLQLFWQQIHKETHQVKNLDSSCTE